MKRLSALLVTLCIALVSFAQGSVTVTQSSAISDLVNNKASKPKPQTPVAPAKPQTPAAPAKPQTQAPPVQQAPAVTSGESAETESSEGVALETEPVHVVHQYSGQPKKKVVPTGTDDEIAEMVKIRETMDFSKSDGIDGKKVMRGAHQIKGWRLQVYNGGNKRVDREKAEELGKKVKKHFPGMPVYVHFYSPRWMTKCGNFKTHKDAEPYKKKLIELGFKNVSIVRQQIIVE